MSTSIKSLLRFLAGLAILAVGFLIAQALIGMKQESTISARPAQPRPVKVVEFVPSDVIPVTPIEGRVDALNRMDVFAEVNGVLALGGREFREGMRFRAGEVMLALDDAEPQAALVAQRSQLLQLLSASMADLRLDYAGSWPQWQAYIQAFDVNGPCEPFPEFSTDREQFFLANRGILSAYHTIRSAEERLAKYAVRAPFDGTLTSTLVRPGALVRAGQPQSMPGTCNVSRWAIGLHSMKLRAMLWLQGLSSASQATWTHRRKARAYSVALARWMLV